MNKSLEEGKTYSINFLLVPKTSTQYDYVGRGTYTGKSMTDQHGGLLFWFTNLTAERGFTTNGWFSVEDIQNS